MLSLALEPGPPCVVSLRHSVEFRPEDSPQSHRVHTKKHKEERTVKAVMRKLFSSIFFVLLRVIFGAFVVNSMGHLYG
jgi:hypothetical protein